MGAYLDLPELSYSMKTSNIRSQIALLHYKCAENVYSNLRPLSGIDSDLVAYNALRDLLMLLIERSVDADKDHVLFDSNSFFEQAALDARLLVLDVGNTEKLTMSIGIARERAVGKNYIDCFQIISDIAEIKELEDFVAVLKKNDWSQLNPRLAVILQSPLYLASDVFSAITRKAAESRYGMNAGKYYGCCLRSNTTKFCYTIGSLLNAYFDGELDSCWLLDGRVLGEEIRTWIGRYCNPFIWDKDGIAYLRKIGWKLKR